MNRFAELLDRLAYEPGRNNKLRLITGYFREVEDFDRGYALAALTGALSFKHAKPGLIRDLIAARTDPVLFALSYDYVGDLSETVALMWPKAADNREASLPDHHLHNNPPPPTDRITTSGFTPVRTTSSTMVAWPCHRSGSSNGCRNASVSLTIDSAKAFASCHEVP